jgi:hypothetical protein
LTMSVLCARVGMRCFRLLVAADVAAHSLTSSSALGGPSRYHLLMRIAAGRRLAHGARCSTSKFNLYTQGEVLKNRARAYRCARPGVMRRTPGPRGQSGSPGPIRKPRAKGAQPP